MNASTSWCPGGLSCPLSGSSTVPETDRGAGLGMGWTSSTEPVGHQNGGMALITTRPAYLDGGGDF